MSKLTASLREALQACGLKDGMCVSFHHHLRNGDQTLNQVMAEIAGMGIRDIRVEASSLFETHAPLIDHIKNGVVTNITSSGLRDKVGAAMGHLTGHSGQPCPFPHHGGRPAAMARHGQGGHRLCGGACG